MTRQPPNEDIFRGVGYGLGTMIFTGLSTDEAYGHEGASPAYTTLLAVIPARRLSAAVLIPVGGKRPETIMRDLLAVLR
jgi:CubicO group peptidase (beta-lactamase class C family)